MVRWIPYVFVRIVILFMVGILLAVYFPGLVPLLVAVSACAGCLVVYVAGVYIRRRHIKGLESAGLLVVLLAGYIHVLLQTESTRPDHILHLEKPITFYKATVIKSPEARNKSWKLEAAIESVKTSGQWHPQRGKVMLYYPKKDSIPVFQYGDVLIVHGTPARVPGPANPQEFDYRRFLAFRNIYHQQFLKENDVKVISNNPSSIVVQAAGRARAWCNAVLKKYISGEQEQAIAVALILGINDGLDNDLMNAYAGTGTLHVLSVSGLHVSVIYLVVLFLLRPFKNLRSGKLILAISSIMMLWLYAFVTGLSPSVLRAVTMFSFMAMAKPWNHRMNIYNTLAISAFLLLLYDPFLIMSLGFQLSYLAVLGIVFIQPGLYNLWEPQTRLWVEIWKVITVSVAAQVATFALGLLYFHQFPIYFLISNLLVIPESFGVLLAGLALLACSFIEPVAHALGIVLQLIIKAMNMTVLTIESFPISRVDGIYISSFQCLLVMLSTAMFVVSLKQKRFNYMIAGVCAVVLFSVVQWIGFYQHVQVQKLAVYSIKNHSAIDLIDNRKAYFFTDPLFRHDKRQIDFHITPNRTFLRVTAISDGDSLLAGKNFTGCRLVRLKDKNIFYITDKSFDFPSSIKADYCIVANNAVEDFEKIRNQLNFKCLVLDGSNSFAFSNKIIRQAEKLKINIHSVLHQGAFVVSL